MVTDLSAKNSANVSDLEALVYYRTHFNAVIINTAKVVLCRNMAYIALIVCVM